MSPWNGSGTINRTDGTRTGPVVWDQARQANVRVNSQDHDRHDEDLAHAIENCVARDGQNSPISDLPMGGRKHTNVDDASERNQYASYAQLLNAATPFVDATGVGGSANAITLAPDPAIAAYTTGHGFRFLVKTANTGPVTVAVSGLAAVSVRRPDGTELESGDLQVGRHLTIIHDGTNWASDALEDAGLDAAAVRTVVGATDLNADRITSGTVAAARLAASPGLAKVLTGTAGGGAAWQDPFSVSKPALWLEPLPTGVRVRYATPASRSAIQSRTLQYRLASQTWSQATEIAITTNPQDVTGLTNDSAYVMRLNITNAEGTTPWSDDTNVTPTANRAHVVSAAGSTSFTWPWADTSAVVVLKGGGGGGAGASLSAQQSGAGGTAGGRTRVVIAGTAVLAAGGAGGTPRYSTFPRPGTERISWGGNGGRGGPNDLQSLQSGNGGLYGDSVYQVVSGVSLGDTIQIEVGAGGAGGDRGTQIASLHPGLAGSAGFAIIAPSA